MVVLYLLYLVMLSPIDVHVQPGDEEMLVDGSVKILSNHCSVLSALSITKRANAEDTRELHLCLNFSVLSLKPEIINNENSSQMHY